MTKQTGGESKYKIRRWWLAPFTVLALIAFISVEYPVFFSLRLLDGSARLLRNPFPVQVFQDGVEISGSIGFITTQGWQHHRMSSPSLVIWCPKPIPEYFSTSTRTVFTLYGSSDGIWIGLPNSGVEREQRLVFGRYLLQTETAGRTIPLGSPKSGLGEPHLQIDSDRIRFSLNPSDDWPNFTPRKYEILCPKEVLEPFRSR